MFQVNVPDSISRRKGWIRIGWICHKGNIVALAGGENASFGERKEWSYQSRASIRGSDPIVQGTVGRLRVA